MCELLCLSCVALLHLNHIVFINQINKFVHDKDGWSPAHYAVRNGHPEMLCLLYNLGVCVTRRSASESNDVPAG
jgi:ankyrin repeat protein